MKKLLMGAALIALTSVGGIALADSQTAATAPQQGATATAPADQNTTNADTSKKDATAPAAAQPAQKTTETDQSKLD